jgi:hypothetical protein
MHEDVGACATAASPAPARPTLAQDAARPHTPHGTGLPAIRVRDAAPWPKASNSICGATRPSASRLQPPRAQQNMPPATRPPCAYAPTTHMPEDRRCRSVGGRRRTAQSALFVAALFVATEHFSTADQLERHTGAPHTPMPIALNCMLSCCLLRALMLVWLKHCILVEFFCTLPYATQNLHTHSNVFDCIATILRRKHACVFLVP